ncbi:transmembrane protein 170B-like isoform X1 [Carassius carassius]|uniref:transmembrane protein 170B-like isoform X1 n=1 Tax=Carassius carassius TaxID=217509 RepID=UPI0028693350|nr:transmembrane protein 170B-like isoform X1 [Carassius carassius]
MCPPSSVRYLSKRAALQPPSANMNKDYSINLSVQQVLSLWVQGTVPTLQHFTGRLRSHEEKDPVKRVHVSHPAARTRLSTPADTSIPSEQEMWYWVFLWCLFSSLFVHGAVGLLMCVTLQRHKRGRLITVVLISVGFLASLTGGVITSAAVAGVYRLAGKDMAPLEALVFGVGQTAFTVIISFSRILATL